VNTPAAPFVVGVGRSGTTLLRLMLDAHPDLAIPGETHFLTEIVKDRAKPLRREDLADLMTGSATWDNLATGADSFRAVLETVEPFSVADGVRAFYRFYAARHGKRRWGDKTGFYLRSMTAIQALLPEAHFIHIIRDGRDIALSRQGLWFGPGDDFDAQARFWVDGIARAREQAPLLAHYMEVRFETLVSRPQQTLNDICNFIGLNFHTAMVSHHAGAAERLAEYRKPFGPADRTPNDIEAFRAIYRPAAGVTDPSRAHRWKTEMGAEVRQRYESIAGPLLVELGYET